MESAINNIGILIGLLGLFYCVKMFFLIHKSYYQKAKSYLFLSLICLAIVSICRYFRFVITVILGIGAMCIAIIGILHIIMVAVSLFILIKMIITRLKARQRIRRVKRQEPPKIKHRVRQKKQKEQIIADIPDESFFEVPLPPGGLE